MRYKHAVHCGVQSSSAQADIWQCTHIQGTVVHACAYAVHACSITCGESAVHMQLYEEQNMKYTHEIQAAVQDVWNTNKQYMPSSSRHSCIFFPYLPQSQDWDSEHATGAIGASRGPRYKLKLKYACMKYKQAVHVCCTYMKQCTIDTYACNT